MAHLICTTHKRRVQIVKPREWVFSELARLSQTSHKAVHSSDGQDCGDEFVSINGNVLRPHEIGG